MKTTIRGSWYDYPHYYDLAFRSESQCEVDFIEAATARFCKFPVRRILEPACGTGRLLSELAGRGYRMTGLDLSRPALDYTKKRLARHDRRATLIEGDMTDFRLRAPVDAAYCLLNSFRHLLTEEAAIKHLECVANNLRPGGLYLLGFHLLPPDADKYGGERWRHRTGQTNVHVSLSVAESCRRRRIERLRVNMLVRTPRRELRLRDEFPLRLYSAEQVRRLFVAAPQFELCEVYDFWYLIDEPQPFDDDLVDAVFVLRRRDYAPSIKSS